MTENRTDIAKDEFFLLAFQACAAAYLWLDKADKKKKRKQVVSTEKIYKDLKLRVPDDFFRYTKMNQDAYEQLFHLLQPELQKRNTRYTVPADCRLALTLSYLATGATFQNLALSFKIGRTTARTIAIETCDVIWSALNKTYVAKPSTARYEKIAEEFQNVWNIPNCVGAVDAKQVVIKCPSKTFSQCKDEFNVMILAACDASCVFTMVDVGAYESQSDGGVLAESEFGKQLYGGKLPLPLDKVLPGTGKLLPHFFVADSAFPLKMPIMRPYSLTSYITTHRTTEEAKREMRIYNYRLSRPRKRIENAFGVLCARWMVLQSALTSNPENSIKVVLATIALHNFVMMNSQSKGIYCPSAFVDREDSDGNMLEGEWRRLVGRAPALQSVSVMRRLGSNNHTFLSSQVRETLKQYFLNEGSILQQSGIM